MKKELPKRYSPQEVEDQIYEDWCQGGYFRPENQKNLEKGAGFFSMVLPPPNVTGTLHLGHAVMLAIQDAMARYSRLSGRRTLWLPGTDHAAIATQAKVDRLLREEGYDDPRQELGREKFLEKVNQFAKQSHDTIVEQMKKMGASVDWEREAYTLDQVRNLAVRTAFKKMYFDGLIYQGIRVINWCPHCKSTLADDEVEYKEEKAKFYYFKYGPVVIGTARPETKFLDKTIIVHPEDSRYQDLIGKQFEIEWIEGRVKANVIADEVADKDFGTGAMTITPGHSSLDFDLAQKYNLPIEKIINEEGRLTEAAGSFAGKVARDCRESIVKILADKGLVDHIDDNYVHNLSICYRCGTPIEPIPKMQWFVDVDKQFAFKSSKRAPIKGLEDGQNITLKQLMQHVVREGEVEIIPDRFNKTYFHWIDNLRDWNISRQIWFGHRVPVWYKGGEVYVGVDSPVGAGWEQDTDTLDTWFSSGLWTFSALGWPDEKSADLQQSHPTSMLETGYDILFFWVARMILMSTYLLGEVPFRKVYLHGLVRDEKGRKMSKSLGNVIDPLDMINKYGADATRLSLIIGATPGNDMKLSEDKVASFRNFTNKLWNISRFVFMNVEKVASVEKVAAVTLDDKWILSEFSKLVEEVTDHFDKYQYSLLGEKLREFTWSKFADVYLENAKIQSGESTNKILLYILERLLILWHPLAPFVTEEIYKQFNKDCLLAEFWPKSAGVKLTDEEVRQFAQKSSIIQQVRLVRAEAKIPWTEQISINLTGLEDIRTQEEALKKLLKLERINWQSGARPQIEINGKKFDL